MRTAAFLALILAACASAPVSDEGEGRAVLAGYAVAPVRDAALAVVEEVAHPRLGVRITDEGSVLTEGGMIGKCGEHLACRISTAYGIFGTHWTTIEVRFRDLGGDTAVEVAIEYESCGPRVDCVPERLASTGKLERQILDGIRSRLDSANGSTPTAG